MVITELSLKLKFNGELYVIRLAGLNIDVAPNCTAHMETTAEIIPFLATGTTKSSPCEVLITTD